MHTIRIDGFGEISGDTFRDIQSQHPDCQFVWMGHTPVSKDGSTTMFMLHHRPIFGEMKYQADEITLLILARRVNGKVKLHCIEETPNPTQTALTPYDTMKVVDKVVKIEVDFRTSQLNLAEIFG